MFKQKIDFLIFIQAFLFGLYVAIVFPLIENTLIPFIKPLELGIIKGLSGLLFSIVVSVIISRIADSKPYQKYSGQVKQGIKTILVGKD